MYDTDRVSRHFLLTKRPGASPMLNLPPDLPPEFSALMGNPFLFEGYMVWNRISSSPMPFQKLLPKSQFDTWLYRHFLKICLPYPRPIVSRSPLHAPLNLTTLIRLAVGMFEVGYPAHWLATIFSSICTGAITTTARPPTKRVSKRADIDAKTAAKTFCVQPWVAEFTTLLSIWRRLLPFGMDSLGGTLVPLGSIHQYSITFSPFPADHERLPHFILIFWNTEVGYSIKPPASIRSLLMGEESQGFVSSKDILEKAIVCVDTFHYTTATRTAEFWMRADKMKEIMAGKWKAFIWRTDSWTSVTGGVDMSSGVVKGKSWTKIA